MNLVMDYLNSLLDDASARMDAHGIPSIVRQVCPYCDGIGRMARAWRVDDCAQCNGNGWINVER